MLQAVEGWLRYLRVVQDYCTESFVVFRAIKGLRATQGHRRPSRATAGLLVLLRAAEGRCGLLKATY